MSIDRGDGGDIKARGGDVVATDGGGIPGTQALPRLFTLEKFLRHRRFRGTGNCSRIGHQNSPIGLLYDCPVFFSKKIAKIFSQQTHIDKNARPPDNFPLGLTKLGWFANTREIPYDNSDNQAHVLELPQDKRAWEARVPIFIS
jgi:hypothetical protein